MDATICACCNCLVNGADTIEMPEQWGDDVIVCSTSCAREIEANVEQERDTLARLVAEERDQI